MVETIPKGTIIDRYGANDTGKYFSPDGSSYESRALPPFMRDMPYERYEVVKPFEVKSGTVAPWFDEPGMGKQYYTDIQIKDRKGNYHDATIENLLEFDYIERIRKDS